jgi:hypothetical protein
MPLRPFVRGAFRGGSATVATVPPQRWPPAAVRMARGKSAPTPSAETLATGFVRLRQDLQGLVPAPFRQRSGLRKTPRERVRRDFEPLAPNQLKLR